MGYRDYQSPSCGFHENGIFLKEAPCVCMQLGLHVIIGMVRSINGWFLILGNMYRIVKRLRGAE